MHSILIISPQSVSISKGDPRGLEPQNTADNIDNQQESHNEELPAEKPSARYECETDRPCGSGVRQKRFMIGPQGRPRAHQKANNELLAPLGFLVVDSC